MIDAMSWLALGIGGVLLLDLTRALIRAQVVGWLWEREYDRVCARAIYRGWSYVEPDAHGAMWVHTIDHTPIIWQCWPDKTIDEKWIESAWRDSKGRSFPDELAALNAVLNDVAPDAAPKDTKR